MKFPMKKTSFALSMVLMASALVLPLSVSAQQSPQLVVPTAPAASIEEYTSRLLGLNQITPRQNPQYKLGSTALNHRLLDQNRRGLGEVTDITLGEGGSLKSIEADVMATGFDQTLVFDVVAYNVTSDSDAFSVTMTRDQVQDNLPDLMAQMDTAAGEDGGQPITVKSLIGARVQTSKGTQIAVVDDVLIQEQRKVAAALLITLMGGAGRTTVAVPYMDAKIDRRGSKATVEVSEEQARVISNYAKKR